MRDTDRIDPYKDYIRRLLRRKGLDTLDCEPLVYPERGEKRCEGILKQDRKVRSVSRII